MDDAAVSTRVYPMDPFSNRTVPDNTSACPDPWTYPDSLATLEFICPIIVLVLFNAVVIVGNTLVVIAVFTHTKLRTVTNTFIVSLAVADLLLGVAVLPFSSANEVLRFWPFGWAWCEVWLIIDVWVCTASILNLCAISLDRYLAISRPFKYPRLMSHLRARILVGTVWVMSFIICFPPLIGWKANSPSPQSEATSASESTELPAANLSTAAFYEGSFVSTVGQPEYGLQQNTSFAVSPSDSHVNCSEHGRAPVCVLNSEPGYVIYSALGSFWIPMLVMSFFYWKIYRAAIRTTSAIRKGVLITKGNHLHSSSPDNQVTLRVHRGGENRKLSPSSPGTSLTCDRLEGFRSPSSSSAVDYQRQMGREAHVGKYKRNPNAMKDTRGRSPSSGIFTGRKADRKSKGVRITFAKSKQDGCCDNSVSEKRPLRSNCSSSPTTEGRAPVFKNIHAQQNGSRVDAVEESQMSPEDSHHDGRTNTGFLTKVSKIQLKSHIKRINKEKKAAKTVGIIVGCFIFCWAPFFTVYLLGAFCPLCTPDILFTIFFWLGYCNSAINPFLYAMCSKDFRYAFKKLLRCRVERKRVERRTSTRFLNFINSIRIQISSKGSDSNSE